MKDQFVRSSWMAALLAASLAACGPGASADAGSDVTNPPDDASTGMDGSTATDAEDARRQRDMGPEIATMGTCDRCFVAVTPNAGPGGTTFTVTGSRFCGTTVTTYIVPGNEPSSACIGVDRMMMRDVPITPDPSDPPTGTWMTTFTASMPAGQYVFCAGRPLAEPCTGGGPFTIR